MASPLETDSTSFTARFSESESSRSPFTMLAPLLDDSIDYWWLDRLKTQKAAVQGPAKRFSNTEEVLTLYDPDGLELEILKT
jgi:hypothetical protein